MDKNGEKLAAAEERGKLPYFLRDNGRFWKADDSAKAAGKYKDVAATLKAATTPRQKSMFVAFEPFSPLIIEQVKALKDRRKKSELFDSILNDSRAEVLHTAKSAKTTCYPNHRGRKTGSWIQTKKMAEELNNHGCSVSFLPEFNDMASAEAIVQFKKQWTVADFKYTGSTKPNTIAMGLYNGFKQANTIILKMAHGDAGTFKYAIEQLKRHECNIGDIMLINKYGKIIFVDSNDLLTNKYIKKIRGKL